MNDEEEIMSLDERIDYCCVAGCTCLTKTPEPQHHDQKCRYRTLLDCQAEIAELRAEADFSYRLTSKQGRLLSKVVNIVKGEPPEDTLWSVHDAPELVAALKAAHDMLVKAVR